MLHIQSEIDARLFAINAMTNNPESFGGDNRVSHRVEILSFEIAKLQFKLDSLH